jgi:DNA-binding response OmpR family regulator
VRALDAGADDAFDARFAPSQMMARTGAVLRRAALVPKTPERVEIDGCVLDFGAAKAQRGENACDLTKREVDLLKWLHRHRDRVVTRAELLEHVWGVSPENTTRAIDVAVAALRAKIERDPREPAIIVSVKGAGYRWG